jgi:hypothetical protein
MGFQPYPKELLSVNQLIELFYSDFGEAIYCAEKRKVKKLIIDLDLLKLSRSPTW